MLPQQILRGEPLFAFSGSSPGPVSAENLRLREDATTHNFELNRRIRAVFTRTTMCREYSAILRQGIIASRDRRDVGPGGEFLVVDLPVAGEAGGHVAPGNVVGLVAVEIADPGEFPDGGVDRAENGPGAEVAVGDAPDADHALVVDHGDVVRAVAVEVTRAKEIPFRRVRHADHAPVDRIVHDPGAVGVVGQAAVADETVFPEHVALAVAVEVTGGDAFPFGGVAVDERPLRAVLPVSEQADGFGRRGRIRDQDVVRAIAVEIARAEDAPAGTEEVQHLRRERAVAVRHFADHISFRVHTQEIVEVVAVEVARARNVPAGFERKTEPPRFAVPVYGDDAGTVGLRRDHVGSVAVEVAVVERPARQDLRSDLDRECVAGQIQRVLGAANDERIADRERAEFFARGVHHRDGLVEGGRSARQIVSSVRLRAVDRDRVGRRSQQNGKVVHEGGGASLGLREVEIEGRTDERDDFRADFERHPAGELGAVVDQEAAAGGDGDAVYQAAEGNLEVAAILHGDVFGISAVTNGDRASSRNRAVIQSAVDVHLTGSDLEGVDGNDLIVGVVRPRSEFAVDVGNGVLAGLAQLVDREGHARADRDAFLQVAVGFGVGGIHAGEHELDILFLVLRRGGVRAVLREREAVDGGRRLGLVFERAGGRAVDQDGRGGVPNAVFQGGRRELERIKVDVVGCAGAVLNDSPDRVLVDAVAEVDRAVVDAAGDHDIAAAGRSRDFFFVGGGDAQRDAGNFDIAFGCGDYACDAAREGTADRDPADAGSVVELVGSDLVLLARLDRDVERAAVRDGDAAGNLAGGLDVDRTCLRVRDRAGGGHGPLEIEQVAVVDVARQSHVAVEVERAGVPDARRGEIAGFGGGAVDFDAAAGAVRDGSVDGNALGLDDTVVRKVAGFRALEHCNVTGMDRAGCSDVVQRIDRLDTAVVAGLKRCGKEGIGLAVRDLAGGFDGDPGVLVRPCADLAGSIVDLARDDLSANDITDAAFFLDLGIDVVLADGVRGQGSVDYDLVEVPEFAGNRNIVRFLPFRADDAIVRDVSGNVEVPDFDDTAVTRLPHVVLVGVLDVAGHIQCFHHGVDEAVVGDRAVEGGMVAYDGDRAGVADRGPLEGGARIEVDRARLRVLNRTVDGQNAGDIVGVADVECTGVRDRAGASGHGPGDIKLSFGLVEDIARQSKADTGEFEQAAVLDRRDSDLGGQRSLAADRKCTAVDDCPGGEGGAFYQPGYGRIINVGDCEETGGIVRDGAGGFDDPGGDSAIVRDVAHCDLAGDDNAAFIFDVGPDVVQGCSLDPAIETGIDLGDNTVGIAVVDRSGDIDADSGFFGRGGLNYAGNVIDRSCVDLSGNDITPCAFFFDLRIIAVTIDGTRGQDPDFDLTVVAEFAGYRDLVIRLHFRAEYTVVRDVSGNFELPGGDHAVVTRLRRVVLIGVLNIADNGQFSLCSIDDAVVGDRAIDGGMVAYDGDRAGVDDRGALQRAARIEVDRAVRHVRDRAGGSQRPGFVQIELAEVGETLNGEDDRAVRRDRAGIVERVGGNGRVDDLALAIVFLVADRKIGSVQIIDIGAALGTAVGVDGLVRSGLVGRFDEFLERGFIPNVPRGDNGRIEIRAYDEIVFGVDFNNHSLQKPFLFG